ncbi:hypothetical protein V1478_008294 [Vespula squamosa]|uniref:Uncharacterized protein n=1 Tax=Vespula squamosa TaxID=30214 RepID=A0ABD2AYD7_VESSQ
MVNTLKRVSRTPVSFSTKLEGKRRVETLVWGGGSLLCGGAKCNAREKKASSLRGWGGPKPRLVSLEKGGEKKGWKKVEKKEEEEEGNEDEDEDEDEDDDEDEDEDEKVESWCGWKVRGEKEGRGQVVESSQAESSVEPEWPKAHGRVLSHPSRAENR